MEPNINVKELKIHSKLLNNTNKIDSNENDTKTVRERVNLTTHNAVKYLLEGTLRLRVCRYCLSVTDVLSELNEILVIAINDCLHEVTIRDMVASFHPFKVNDDENFPNKICGDCLKQTIECYLFTQKCEQAERALRNCFNDMYDKFEKLDTIEPVRKRGKRKLHPNHNTLYTEHKNVMEYAEPIINIVNVNTIPVKEKEISDLECQKCWQVLPNLESLLNHEKSHPDSMWFSCKICGKSFVKRYHLKKHLKENHLYEEELNNDTEIFKCNECGSINETLGEHLQHTEKHKFKVTLNSLIEKKVEDLCSVCIEKGTKMIDLNEVIHLHGGYPNLMGKRTVHDILNDTLPKQNKSKYQEFLLPSPAKLIKFVRKDNAKLKVTVNDGYKFSLPIFLETNELHSNESFHFTLSKPLVVKRVEYCDKMETNANYTDNYEITDYKFDCTEDTDVKVDSTKDIIDDKVNSTEDSDEEVDLTKDTEDEINSTEDTDNGVNSTKDTDDKVESSKNTENITVKNIDQKFISCEICWIFKRPACNKCLNRSSNKEDEINSSNVESDCKMCWLFKNSVKCENCKKTNFKTETYMIEKNSRTDFESNSTIGNTEKLQQLAGEKIFSAKPFNDTFSQEHTWQCYICLTINKNRYKCVCCRRGNANTDENKEDKVKNFAKDDKPEIKKFESTKLDYKNESIANDTINFATTSQPNNNFLNSNASENKNLFDSLGEVGKIKNIDYKNVVIQNKDISLNKNIHNDVLPMEIEEPNTNESMDFEESNTNIIVTKTQDVFKMESNAPQPKITFNIGSGDIKGRRIKRPLRRMMPLDSYLGTKICDICLNHTITAYVFLVKIQYIRKRLNTCVTLMLKQLDDVDLDVKNDPTVMVQISQDTILPYNKVDSIDEILADEVDEIKVDVLEDEFRESESSDESESDNDERHENEENEDLIENPARNATKTYLKRKLVNGYQSNYEDFDDSLIDNICSEFLTFKRRKTVKLVPWKYTCPFCNKYFISDYFVKKHILKHIQIKVECSICLKTFNSKFHLFEHKKVVHVLKNHNFVCCKTCGRSFSDFNKLKRHKRCHSTKLCVICDKKFISQNHYDIHMQRHALKFRTYKNKNEQTCSFCEKACSNENELSLHVNKTHLQIKPYNCDMCEKQFYTEYNLCSHKKLHSLFSKESCVFCDKNFKCRKDLVIHVRKHMGSKPHHCPVCRESFYSNAKKKKHMRSSHGGTFCCRLCRMIMCSQVDLRNHINVVHSSM